MKSKLIFLGLFAFACSDPIEPGIRPDLDDWQTEESELPDTTDGEEVPLDDDNRPESDPPIEVGFPDLAKYHPEDTAQDAEIVDVCLGRCCRLAKSFRWRCFGVDGSRVDFVLVDSTDEI